MGTFSEPLKYMDELEIPPTPFKQRINISEQVALHVHLALGPCKLVELVSHMQSSTVHCEEPERGPKDQMFVSPLRLPAHRCCASRGLEKRESRNY